MTDPAAPPSSGGRTTRVLVADEAGVAQAAALIAGGGLVALPTETVYGLGADATSPDAVARIFAAKGRPATDPLIVHVADPADAAAFADIGSGGGRGGAVAEVVAALQDAFWPGPLTVVVPRRGPLAAAVGGGGPTVGLRCPAHRVARDLIRAAGVPVAAPSANRFGRVSPTTAAHVVEELGGRIDAVLDAGATPLGVESTVVAVAGPAAGASHPRPTVRLLRPGGVTAEDLADALGDLAGLDDPGRLVRGATVAAESPGTLLAHYAPEVPVVLVEAPPHEAADLVAALADALARQGVQVARLALATEPAAAAAELYGRLRALDAGAGAEVALVAPVDPTGIGRAVNDRLFRAAHGLVVTDASERTVARVLRRCRP